MATEIAMHGPIRNANHKSYPTDAIDAIGATVLDRESHPQLSFWFPRTRTGVGESGLTDSILTLSA